jgi:type II secretory pathway pseudopilin PulG
MSPDRLEPNRTGTGGRTGFVLFESLVALAVAALLLTMLSRSFLATWQGTAHAREDLQAMMIARTVLEDALPRGALSPGVKTGMTGGYDWRAETLPAPAQAEAEPASGEPTGQQLDVAPAAGGKWQLYRVLVTVGSPSGRRVRLEAFMLGA